MNNPPCNVEWIKGRQTWGQWKRKVWSKEIIKAVLDGKIS
jgi:hypothetical protein